VTQPPRWQVHAIRYASAERTVHGNFLRPAGLADGPMRIDFFLWVAIGEEDGRAVVIDTGFNRASSARRDRVQLCDPRTALGAVQVDIDRVRDVVLTHMHYDHADNLAAFPVGPSISRDARCAMSLAPTWPTRGRTTSTRATMWGRRCGAVRRSAVLP